MKALSLHGRFLSGSLILLASGGLALSLLSDLAETSSTASFAPASFLPDLSGLGYVGDGRFLAVHDAKNPDELDRPRVSLLQVPEDLDGILWLPADVDWNGMESSDLESVARIPGTDRFLLAESGDDADPNFQHIFRARVIGNSIEIETVVDWPVPVFNVEATAVAQVKKSYYFLYAERADNAPSTMLNWARFNPTTMSFGTFQSVELQNPDPTGTNRPVVGLDVDADGRILTISSFDPEAAGLPGDPDFGPYRSSVWEVGRLVKNKGKAEIVLAADPVRVAKIDGFKAESVAIDADGQVTTIFVGFDDEDYGGTMRPMPPLE